MGGIRSISKLVLESLSKSRDDQFYTPDSWGRKDDRRLVDTVLRGTNQVDCKISVVLKELLPLLRK